jgi:hypothetical protein
MLLLCNGVKIFLTSKYVVALKKRWRSTSNHRLTAVIGYALRVLPKTCKTNIKFKWGYGQNMEFKYPRAIRLYVALKFIKELKGSNKVKL